MTTSSNHHGDTTAAKGATRSHWHELTLRLPKQPVDELGDWFDEQLAALEKSQERFMTGRSILKSLRRNTAKS